VRVAVVSEDGPSRRQSSRRNDQAVSAALLSTAVDMSEKSSMRFRCSHVIGFDGQRFENADKEITAVGALSWPGELDPGTQFRDSDCSDD